MHMNWPLETFWWNYSECRQNGSWNASSHHHKAHPVVQALMKLGELLAQKCNFLISADRYWIIPFIFLQGTIKSLSFLWEPPASKLRRLCPAGTFWVSLISEPVFQSVWTSDCIKIWFSGTMGFGPWELDTAEEKILQKSWSEYWVSLMLQWCSTLSFRFTSFSVTKW